MNINELFHKVTGLLFRKAVLSAPEKRKGPARTCGSKLAKKARKHAVGLKNGQGGVVAEAIREMQIDKNLAKIANK